MKTEIGFAHRQNGDGTFDSMSAAIVREWLYAVGGLMAGFVFTALTQPHDYATGWLTLLAPYVVFQSIRCSVRTAKTLRHP